MTGFDSPSAHHTGERPGASSPNTTPSRRRHCCGSTSTGRRIGASIRWSFRRLFINPTSPDLDNLTVALFQALDGKCGQGPTLFDDDRRIVLLNKIGILFS
jgi:hypothetical protein